MNQLTWKIWFAGDCGRNQAGQLRSYDIVKVWVYILTIAHGGQGVRKNKDFFIKKKDYIHVSRTIKQYTVVLSLKREEITLLKKKVTLVNIILKTTMFN